MVAGDGVAQLGTRVLDLRQHAGRHLQLDRERSRERDAGVGRVPAAESIWQLVTYIQSMRTPEEPEPPQ